jgi:GNAT superfamily N-acetyltransferase
LKLRAETRRTPGVPEIRFAQSQELELLVAIDDDSAKLYATAGVAIDLPSTHPFIVDERRRWSESLQAGRTLLAMNESGDGVGFAVVDLLDGAAYLDQLSVRMSAMRRGVGTALVRAALALGHELGADAMWLTTYGHLPWNVPFYEKLGFVLMPEAEWGAGVLHHVEAQRESLPLPEERVAMRAPLPVASRRP